MKPRDTIRTIFCVSVCLVSIRETQMFRIT